MRKDKYSSFASQHKVECEHVRDQENAPSFCIQAWWMWGLPRTEATKSRDGRANGTRGLEWARHMCKESKQHHSTFSSTFSTSGEFPKIPQAIFRCFFIKTKSGFSSLRWLGCKSRVLSLGQTAAGQVPWIVNMCHLKPKLEVQWLPWDSWI